MKQKLLIIAGPTGVGKSSISIELAKIFGGEIVSCDSMQIYKDCNIGTAKIMQEEMQGIPHHMIDIVQSNSEFSVSEYKDMAEKIIHDIFLRQHIPILVGGTGLYIQSLLYGYKFCNVSKNNEVRKKYELYLEKHGKEALYNLLKDKNKERAKELHINDTKRVIRALEISELQNGNNIENSVVESKYDFYFCVLNKDREMLYHDINNRVDEMIKNDLEGEVRNLLANGTNFECQCMQSIGYKEWQPYFKNECSKEEVIEKIKQNTRKYAKRQITWFKHREKVHFYEMPNDKNKIIKDIKDWLEK